MSKLRLISFFLALSAFLLSFSGCRSREPAAVEEPFDPHEGMVFAENGEGGKWVPLYEGLPVAAYDDTLFTADGEYINYDDPEAQTMRGIDVSSLQGEIDWAAVASDGVEFAIIRVCYRGYTQGILYEDEYARRNIEGALANGIRVGVYCFSQAVSIRDAEKEAALTLSVISDYDITMPVVFDWEHIGGGEEARTDGMDYELITDCCIAFCDAVREAGYRPMVYFYESLGYEVYDLGRLAGYDFWLADPGSVPGFYYDFSIWQYSYTASVAGIEGDVDLDLALKAFE